MTVRAVPDGPYRFRIEPAGDMRVPGVVFASPGLLEPSDQALEQVANVATLPGIVDASYAMPDIHWGYGFPIGGVAATDPREGGVISPGGVGFDISCGVRLMASDIDANGFEAVLQEVMDELDPALPRGMGKGAAWRPDGRGELIRILTGGSRYAVEQGHGEERDLLRCEDAGAVADADPAQVSERAMERGSGQVGSLGSGNHFLELQRVAEVYDAAVAEAFGLWPDQICVMVHTGSRGLGHQVCTDHVRVMEQRMPRHGITVPDRQLACAPVESEEGRAYMGAMAAAANYGRANRQFLAQAARQVFQRVAGARLDLVYDVSHNLVKLEEHDVDGERRLLCVHRKGATRALPPGHPDLPGDLRDVGQPVLIPGTMSTSSYVLAGVPDAPAFASTCHGAGRVQSRKQAARGVSGKQLRATMEAAGIAVRPTSWRGLAEEGAAAYKEVSEVIEASEGAGLGRKIARLAPIGVLKG